MSIHLYAPGPRYLPDDFPAANPRSKARQRQLIHKYVGDEVPPTDGELEVIAWVNDAAVFYPHLFTLEVWRQPVEERAHHFRSAVFEINEVRREHPERFRPGGVPEVAP